MRQLIAAVDVIIPGREPHIDAVDDGVRLSEMVADEDGGNERRDA